jgi:SAM-dependent methyltransferase
MANHPARSYNAEFYRETASLESAREVLTIMFEILRPRSVIDIGCGVGHWLAAAKELGATDVLGIDGEWVQKAQLAISPENFITHDLAKPLSLNRRFDLALSLEVAEHLPEAVANTFIKTLCAAAAVVVFSAAIPGQGGRHHVNERWPEYWAGLFSEQGYECYDYLRPRIWNNPRVTWYYAQNSLIFVKRGESQAFGEPCTPLPLVHPALWSAETARMRNPGKLLERLAKVILRG